MTQGSRSAYPGERLGLPESGPGSLAPVGRRVAALTIDWLIAYGLAA
ncbi:MAG: RDD family protein, partial [Mycobacterium sp.]